MHQREPTHQWTTGISIKSQKAGCFWQNPINWRLWSVEWLLSIFLAQSTKPHGMQGLEFHFGKTDLLGDRGWGRVAAITGSTREDHYAQTTTEWVGGSTVFTFRFSWCPFKFVGGKHMNFHDFGFIQEFKLQNPCLLKVINYETWFFP